MTPTEQDKNPSNSTPTEQDKELRAELAKLEVYTTVKSEKHPLYHKDIDKIMQLITADRKRVALEARIEALDHVIDLQDKQFRRWTQMDIANFFNGVGKYYRELKAQQEEK